jgi:hypothetical protein
MDAIELQADIKRALELAGFSVAHESAAVVIFRHPDHPRVMVRTGTTHVLVEVNGEPRHRVPLAEFDVRLVRRYL